MVRWTMVALAVGLVAPGAALAERSLQRCSKPNEKVADAAIGGSLELAARAAAAVGSTDEYLRWFGAFDRGRQEEVRANLKAIHRELQADEVRAVCLHAESPDCLDGAYAFVRGERPPAIYLCPSFFAMPSLEDARNGLGDLENGTREGTIIHEMSHFPYIARTSDECYSRTECGHMARDAERAIINADSYQYFAEDVMLLFWATPG
jgi:peptidyl-Lys metalloendopeptidase